MGTDQHSVWRLVAAAAGAMLLWAVVVVAGTIDGWWRKPLAPRGDLQTFTEAAISRIGENLRGNAVLVLIEAGKSVGEHAASTGDPVGPDTLFQVASLSKWISAWGVMTLVEAGRLDLDAPVSTYLTRWHLPESEHDNSGVTVRRLLSHTAGLTDGLGYGGFPPGVPVQSLEDSLTRAADASPGRDGRVLVGLPPGTEWRYSGGGYTLLQLLVEEVSGEPFPFYMRRAVFEPLGMRRSTFAPGQHTPDLATFYDADGSVATHYRFTALAAASLYTSAADLTRFIAAHLPDGMGAPAGRGVISAEAVTRMRQPEASQLGVPIWGLGAVLYARNGSGDYIAGHDGNNAPAINTAARFDPASGDGIVVLSTGNGLLATELAGEWVFWKTGTIDVLAITMAIGGMSRLAIGGTVAILLGAAMYRARRRRTNR